MNAEIAMILDNGVLRFTGNGILSDDPMDPCGSFEDLVTVRPFSVLFQHCTRTRDGGNRSRTLSNLSIHQVTTMVRDDDDDERRAIDTSTGTRDASDLRGWSAGVGAAHYFPRSARTN